MPIKIDPPSWMSARCSELGGSIQADGMCHIDPPHSPYPMCLKQPNTSLIIMDANIRPYRKWWWLGLFFICPIGMILIYPIWGWNVFNQLFYELVAFVFIVYGRRLDKSWLILMILISIYIVWFFSALAYALIVNNVWYPDDYDWAGHVLAGFGLYVVVSTIGQLRHPAVNFAIAVVLGILYEVSEWFCSTFYALPNLWWDLGNAVFDVRNNIIGGIIALVIETIVRQVDCRAKPSIPQKIH